MLKTKSVECFALLCILIFMASLLHAQSSENYRSTSSVLDEMGGAAQSENYRQPFSSGGQPSSAGDASSENYGNRAGYCFTVVEDIGIKGDVDNDASVTVLDVLAVVNHILRIEELTGTALLRADCDSNGELNIIDVIGIVNVILGIGECTPGVLKEMDAWDILNEERMKPIPSGNTSSQGSKHQSKGKGK